MLERPSLEQDSRVDCSNSWLYKGDKGEISIKKVGTRAKRK
jgi:hypothetical protein